MSFVTSSASEETLPPPDAAAVRVRPLRLRDWRAMTRLLQQTYPQLDAAWIGDQLRNAPHCFAIAVTQEGLAGVVRLRIHPGERCTELDLLAVEPAQRERGVAAALLRYVTEVACACGAPRLEAWIEADNGPVHALLVGAGYQLAPAVAAPGHGRRKPAIAAPEGWMGRITGSEQPLLRLTHNAPSPVWPEWSLRRSHAPRVPPGVVERTARLALYGAWRGAGSVLAG